MTLRVEDLPLNWFNAAWLQSLDAAHQPSTSHSQGVVPHTQPSQARQTIYPSLDENTQVLTLDIVISGPRPFRYEVAVSQLPNPHGGSSPTTTRPNHRDIALQGIYRAHGDLYNVSELPYRLSYYAGAQ
jgi:hypothetical protein